MKITHFVWEYPPVIYGGLGTFAEELTKKQNSLNHNINVFSLNPANKYDELTDYDGVKVFRPKTLDLTDSLRLFADYEIRAWGDNFKFFADVVSYNLTSAFRYKDLLSNNLIKKSDFIHAHDWLGILSGIAVKKEIKKPLFFHVHSTEVGRSIGRGSHNIKEIEFEGSQIADCVITVSNAMKDELEKLGFPSDKIRVCWNGVDPSKYDPKKISSQEKQELRKKYGINDDENMLFFVGRLVNVKGVDHLIKAMPEILSNFPKTKLVILGVGGLLDDLRKLADRINVSQNVIFRDEFVSEHERIVHYAASDCVVLPSVYEPFGIVCTESMSMGKPTVVGARGTNGFREQIIPDGDNKSGVHVNGGNPSDIAWGVKQLIGMPDKGLWVGKNARKRVMEKFTWEHVAENVIKIYQEFS